MSYVVIGGNYYGHIADYLFAPSYAYSYGSYGYPHFGDNYYSPWYGYGSYEYPYYR
jgi:hypothetical protein